MLKIHLDDDYPGLTKLILTPISLHQDEKFSYDNVN